MPKGHRGPAHEGAHAILRRLQLIDAWLAGHRRVNPTMFNGELVREFEEEADALRKKLAIGIRRRV